MKRCMELAAAVLGILTSAVYADGVIELRPSVVMQAGDVRLGDIATLQGKEALALADVIVAPNLTRGGTRIGLEQVSATLAKQDGVNMGLLRFHGSACTVSFPAPVAPVDPHPAEAPATGPTVRDLLPQRIAELLSLDTAEMRVSFDEADRKLLDQATGGRVVEVKPVGTGDKMPIQVSIYEERIGQGHVLVASGTVRMGIEVKQEVMVAKLPLKRGDVVVGDSFTATRQWMNLSHKPAKATDLVGSIVKSGRIGAGSPLLDADVEQAIAIKKGSLASVHVLSGGFVVKTQARALESGKIGDVIRFSSTSGKEGRGAKTFEARVESAGRAIMSLGAEAK